MTNHTLEQLSERGHERGADAVFDGARRSVKRYRRRRSTVGTVGCMAVLVSVIGAAAWIRDDGPSVDTGPGDASPQTIGPPHVAEIRLEGHDGFDRIVTEFDVDQIPPPVDGPDDSARVVDEDPACEPPPEASMPFGGFTSGIGGGIAEWDTPDGLPPGMHGTPITGDTTYIDAVYPMCVREGVLWYAITYKLDVPGFMENAAQPDAVTKNCDLEHPYQIIGDTYDVDEMTEADMACPEPDGTPRTDTASGTEVTP